MRCSTNLSIEWPVLENFASDNFCFAVRFIAVFSAYLLIAPSVEICETINTNVGKAKQIQVVRTYLYAKTVENINQLKLWTIKGPN